MSLGSKRFLVVSKRYWAVRFFKMTEVKRRIFRIFWHIRIQQNRNCWLSQSRVHFRLWKQWLLDEGHVLKVGALRTLFWERSIFDENSKNESSLDHYRALRKTLWRVLCLIHVDQESFKIKMGTNKFRTQDSSNSCTQQCLLLSQAVSTRKRRRKFELTKLVDATVSFTKASFILGCWRQIQMVRLFFLWTRQPAPSCLAGNKLTFSNFSHLNSYWRGRVSTSP